MSSTQPSSRPSWNRSNAKRRGKKSLSTARKKTARKGARRTRQPYPSLIDNMREAVSLKKAANGKASSKKGSAKKGSKKGLSRRTTGSLFAPAWKRMKETRLALTAAALTDSVPKTVDEARRIAQKRGRAIFGRYWLFTG